MKCYAIENHPNDSRVKIDPQGIVQCLSSRMGTGGNNMPFVLISCRWEQKTMIYWTCQGISDFVRGECSSSLMARDYKDGRDLIQEEEMEGQDRKYVLRRLTPIECLRLQGLPDWWCDGANGSDSAIYKMAGNGLAVPCACDVLGRIAEEMRKDEK